jgi:hypothetical protein
VSLLRQAKTLLQVLSRGVIADAGDVSVNPMGRSYRQRVLTAGESPKANFPANREKYRNSAFLKSIQTLDQLKACEITAFFERIP